MAIDGYLAVRGFLKGYAGNQATYNSYQTHFERLLLWSVLIVEKPLTERRRRDATARTSLLKLDWTELAHGRLAEMMPASTQPVTDQNTKAGGYCS